MRWVDEESLAEDGSDRILPRERLTCVPSMFDSLGVQVPYTT